MKTVFIYALCEPGTRTVRYIGLTKNMPERLKQHLKDSVKKVSPLGDWLRSLNNVSPNMVKLSEVAEADGPAEEIRFIAAARTSLGMDLVNATKGGQGCSDPSPETLKKMSVASKARWEDPKYRAKFSASNSNPVVKAAKSAALKLSLSLPEARARMSAQSRAALENPKVKAARCAGLVAVHSAPGYSKRVSDQSKSRWSDPAYINKVSAAQKAARDALSPEAHAKNVAARSAGLRTPEARAKASEKSKDMQASPEYRAKMGASVKAALADPSVRARISESMKLKWQDPEYVQRVLASRKAAKEKKNMRGIS